MDIWDPKIWTAVTAFLCLVAGIWNLVTQDTLRGVLFIVASLVWTAVTVMWWWEDH